MRRMEGLAPSRRPPSSPGRARWGDALSSGTCLALFSMTAPTDSRMWACIVNWHKDGLDLHCLE